MEKDVELIQAALSGIPEDGGVPDEIKLLPMGFVKTRKGDFIVDDESAGSIIRQFKDRKLDLVIDYEHQTLKDIEAPAGGWITDLFKGDGAIIAKVKWTPRAENYLKNREYRYLSPVVLVSKKDRRALSVHSAALTNTPAIDGMFAIVNSDDIETMETTQKEDFKMDLKEIAKRLGLPEDAAESDIAAALELAGKKLAEGGEAEKPGDGGGQPAEASVNKDAAPATGRVLSLLGLKEDVKEEDVLARIMALSAKKEELEELVALKEELKKREAGELVEAALKDGKITAAQKEWAQEYALSDKEGFVSFLEKAPVVVPQGRMELKDAPGHSAADIEPEILKNCGLTKEDVEKYVLGGKE